jgi:hypothetical protein
MNSSVAEQDSNTYRVLEVQKLVVPKIIIDKVHDTVLTDRRVKVRELSEAVGISTERVHFILHHELHNMKKNCARPAYT